VSTATEPELFDRAEVVAEVRAAFDRYERALVAGDVAVLTELFWADPRCVRFGVTDRQQGDTEIAAWRAAHPSVAAGRRLWETRVIAVDDRTAVVTTLFDYPDRVVEGRQSQTWVRFADGWRVVAAHVSELQRGHPAATGSEQGAPAAIPTVPLAVVAAHRTGQPLHPELVALGTRPVGVALTAPVYRLVALPGPGLPRGGLIAVGAGGHAIEVELHEVPTVCVGALLAALPSPLALGRVQLPEGEVLGMVCASAPAEAVDVSEWGSWPAYLAAVEVGAVSG
jgi:Protein of unknown function (DUF3225)